MLTSKMFQSNLAKGYICRFSRIFKDFLPFPLHFDDIKYFTDEHQGQDKAFEGFTVSVFSVIGI